MENILISVIIPVYNVEKYLGNCLDSIINQTYKNLEIILVDDGSKDNSRKICDDYAKVDNRIKVIHKENGGVSNARNDGINIAKGEYIGFVDSDDWLEKDMFEFLLNNAKKYNANISMCCENVYENGEKIPEAFNGSIINLNKNEAKKKTVVGGSMGFIWNKIYKKSIMENIRFAPEYGCSEDLLFVYECVCNSNNVVCANQPKYNYFRREGGITKGEFGYGAFGVVDVMKKMLDNERDTDVFLYAVKGYTSAAFVVLSGVITSKKCLDKFDELCSGLLSYKKQILHGGLHSKTDKMKIILLGFSKPLYKLLIHIIRGK